MPGQFDKFHALDPGKQQRIIYAALAEFAAKGLARASTNAIAEAAGISKGMLFYYFGTKGELYEFLAEYVFEYAKAKYLPLLRCETRDFLERCRLLTDIKRAAMVEFPQHIAFFSAFFKDDQNAMPHIRQEMISLQRQVMTSLYDGIDFHLFREDMDPKSIVKYIQWLIDSYQNKVQERFLAGEFAIFSKEDTAEEWRLYDQFMVDLRLLFYK